MPSVRRSVQLPLPERFVPHVLIVVFAAAATALVAFSPPASSACEISMPKPLRVLYKESALVAVVRVGESVAVEQEESSTLMRTDLRITSLLKGESKKKVVALYDYVWEGEDESSTRVRAKKDDVLLVFLSPYEKDEGFVPAEFERALKKLSPDDLKVYVSRIEELAAIMRSEKPDASALTEWLVRCAEDPATRWEGAYELSFGASLLGDVEEAVAAASDTAGEEPASEEEKDEGEKAGGESVEPAAEAAATSADQNDNNESADGEKVEVNRPAQVEERIDFAVLLTPAQKERLIQTLLNAEEFEWSEQMLLRLAGNWKDARLVSYSLKHLARMADKPLYNAEDLMRVVAHTLGDASLIRFVADYNKTAAYVDLYDNGGSDNAGADTEDDESTAEERAEHKKELEAMKAAAAEALFQRSGKLRHFLALADQPQKP